MKIILYVSVVLVLLVSCGPSQETVATQTSYSLTSTAAIWTKTVTPTSTSTVTPTSTATLSPTPTSTPFAGFQVNNKLIAYKINSAGLSFYRGDIETSLLNGSNSINLTSEQTGNKILGGWSPDGEMIIYGRWEDENTNVTARDASHASPIELWKMDSDGSNKGRLPIDVVANDIRIINRQSNWDDDNLLIPCLTGGEQTELCIVNVKESSVEKTGNYGEDPSYSPNRNAYAWLIVNYGLDFINAMLSEQNLSNLFVIQKGERYPAKLPMPTKKQIEGYSWLPDSKNLIVLFAEKDLGEIYEIGADGTTEPVLILRINTKLGLPEWGGLSPDGKYLLIEDFANIGKSMGCIVNLSEKTTICLDQGYNRFIWTPDSQLVAQKENIAYIFDLETGKPTQSDQLNWLFSGLLQP